MEQNKDAQNVQDLIKSFSSTKNKPITCKAAVALQPKKPLQIMEIEVAPPKKGQLRIKVLSNALCHTDIYTLDGFDAEGLFPCILGHEATAVVESVGEGVTSVQVGDLIIPCYTPECQESECIFCQSDKTNLCPKIRGTQGKGVMPDGTSRFSFAGGDKKMIYHFMGCSTFSEYSVIAQISAAKINRNANYKQMCMLGCGVATGWGAVFNTCKVESGKTVAVFGLGAVGLAVIQAAKKAGSRRIVGIDLNSKKFQAATKFGATDCVNPQDVGDVKNWLLEQEKWGYDYTFDCTGNVKVMNQALQVAHRGWGESCVIGVAAAGHQLATRPFHLVTGRVWKGTAFGGWKSRSQVPKLVQAVMRGEMPISDFVTHNYDGLEKVNDSIKALHQGNCLRAVIHISDVAFGKENIQTFQIVNRNKVQGGQLLRIKHYSKACNCDMKFSIYVPNQHFRKQQKPGVLYYLSGLTCTDQNARTKTAFWHFLSEYNMVMVFPDTSPRDTKDIPKAQQSWDIGSGAGFYVNATSDPWNKHYKMYDYINYELPNLISSYFAVDSTKIGITGHSMGGHGALIMHLKNPGKFKSVSAFAPITNPTNSPFGQKAFKQYFGSVEGGKQYDACELMLAGYKGENKIPILIDQGTDDEFLEKNLTPWRFQQACEKSNYPVRVRMQKGYDHSYFFVSTFIRDHIEFHAHHMGIEKRTK